MLKAVFIDRVIDVKKLTPGTIVYWSKSKNCLCADDWEPFHIKFVIRTEDGFALSVEDAERYFVDDTRNFMWGE